MEPAERRGAEGRGRDRRRLPTPFRGAAFITLAREPAGTARPASPLCPFESPAPICRVLEVAELEAAGRGEGVCPPLSILMVTHPGRSGGGLFPQQPPSCSRSRRRVPRSHWAPQPSLEEPGPWQLMPAANEREGCRKVTLTRRRPGLPRAPHGSRGPCQEGVCVPSAGPQPSCVRGEACRRLLGLDLTEP